MSYGHSWTDLSICKQTSELSKRDERLRKLHMDNTNAQNAKDKLQSELERLQTLFDRSQDDLHAINYKLQEGV